MYLQASCNTLPTPWSSLTGRCVDYGPLTLVARYRVPYFGLFGALGTARPTMAPWQTRNSVNAGQPSTQHKDLDDAHAPPGPREMVLPTTEQMLHTNGASLVLDVG